MGRVGHGSGSIGHMINQASTQHPCTEALDQIATLAERVHSFLYVGDVSRDEIRDVVCGVFHAMKDCDWSPEEALACCKETVNRIARGGSLSQRDDVSGPWLRDQLVRWLVECYYAESVPA